MALPVDHSFAPRLEEVHGALAAVRELLVCPTCNGLVRDPHTLPCLHRFCRQCLENRAECKSCSHPFYPSQLRKAPALAALADLCAKAEGDVSKLLRAYAVGGGKENVGQCLRAGTASATVAVGGDISPTGAPHLHPARSVRCDEGRQRPQDVVELPDLRRHMVLLERRIRAHRALIMANTMGPLAGELDLPCAPLSLLQQLPHPAAAEDTIVAASTPARELYGPTLIERSLPGTRCHGRTASVVTEDAEGCAVLRGGGAQPSTSAVPQDLTSVAATSTSRSAGERTADTSAASAAIDALKAMAGDEGLRARRGADAEAERVEPNCSCTATRPCIPSRPALEAASAHEPISSEGSMCTQAAANVLVSVQHPPHLSLDQSHAPQPVEPPSETRHPAEHSPKRPPTLPNLPPPVHLPCELPSLSPRLRAHKQPLQRQAEARAQASSTQAQMKTQQMPPLDSEGPAPLLPPSKSAQPPLQPPQQTTQRAPQPSCEHTQRGEDAPASVQPRSCSAHEASDAPPRSVVTEPVILFTGIEVEESVSATKVAKQLGARVVPQWKSSVTHVISGSKCGPNARGDDRAAPRLCGRTIKYCSAILHGQWIVALEWLRRSEAHGYLIDEEPFEIEGDHATMHPGTRRGAGGPRAGRLRKLEGRPKLFAGLTFILHGDFVKPSRAEMLKVLQAGGGTVREELPKPGSTRKRSAEPALRTFVLSQQVPPSAELCQECDAQGLPTPIDATSVMNAISHHEVSSLLSCACPRQKDECKAQAAQGSPRRKSARAGASNARPST